MIVLSFLEIWIEHQKQPARGVLRKSCFENMQQIYRRTPMSSILSQASSRYLGYFGKSTIDLTYGNSKSSIKSQLLVRAKLTT